MASKEPESPRSLVHRFFVGCLLLLGGVIALQLALSVLAQIWGWLLLGAMLVAATIAALWFIRSRRDRW